MLWACTALLLSGLAALQPCARAAKAPQWMEANNFSPAPPFSSHWTSGEVCDGGLYTFGGTPESPSHAMMFHHYDPPTETWTDLSGTTSAWGMIPLVQTSAACSDSRLFFFGGMLQDDTIVSTFRIFAPKTITWTNVTAHSKGSIPTPRMYHRMAAANGKLYLHGGLQCSVWGECDGFEELFEFDIETSTWIQLPINIGYRSHNALGVVDDRLFVIGGINWGGAGGHQYLSEMWEYSLSLQTWTDLSGLLHPHVPLEHSASTVHMGKLYIRAWGLLEWDPELRTWRDLSYEMQMDERAGYRPVLGAINGVLYLFGGSKNWPPQATNALYTLRIEDNAWSDKSGVVQGVAPQWRLHFGLAAVGEELLVFGGRVNWNEPTVFGDLHRYDATRWTQLTPTGSAPSPRWAVAMAGSPDSAFVFGGGGFRGMDDTYLSDLFQYHAPQNTWSALPQRGAVPGPRHCSTNCLAWQPRQLLLFGGTCPFSACDMEVFRFDLQSLSWSQLAPADLFPGPSGLWSPGAAVCGQRVFVFGGLRQKHLRESRKDLWSFDLDTLQWQEWAQDPALYWPPEAHGIAMACSGRRVFMYGGTPAGWTGVDRGNKFSMLDPETGRWTALEALLAGDPPMSRTSARMVATGSGKLFMLGGEQAQVSMEHVNLPMPLERFPTGPRDVPFPTSAVGWGPVYDWDRVVVPGGAGAKMEYSVDLCTSVFPCRAKVGGDGVGRLELAAQAALRCDAGRGCEGVEVEGVELECGRGRRGEGPFQVAGARMRLARGVVRGCEAEADGGVVRAVGGAEVEVEAARFEGCHSQGSGGAISAAGSAVAASNASFVNCSAAAVGGAVHLHPFQCYPAAPQSPSATLDFTQVQGCSAAQGGGLWSSGGEVRVRGSLIEGCCAHEDGGAMAVAGGSTAVEESVLRGNTAGGRGGAVSQAGGKLSASGAWFDGNKAGGGGGAAVFAEGAGVELHGETLHCGELDPRWDCAPGAELGLGGCRPCLPGTYKQERGPGACERCPEGSGSEEGARSALGCACLAGFSGPDGGPCAACEAGAFKAAQGSAPCEACPLGSLAAERGAVRCSPACPAGSFWQQAGGAGAAEARCEACGAGRTSEAGSVGEAACRCMPGHAPADDGPCAPCPPGTFKNASGSQHCRPCPLKAEAPAGSAACACPAGHGWEGGECVACKAGSFSPGGDAACMACGGGEFSGPEATGCELCSEEEEWDGARCVAKRAGAGALRHRYLFRAGQVLADEVGGAPLEMCAGGAEADLTTEAEACSINRPGCLNMQSHRLHCVVTPTLDVRETNELSYCYWISYLARWNYYSFTSSMFPSGVQPSLDAWMAYEMGASPRIDMDETTQDVLNVVTRSDWSLSSVLGTPQQVKEWNHVCVVLYEIGFGTTTGETWFNGDMVGSTVVSTSQDLSWMAYSQIQVGGFSVYPETFANYHALHADFQIYDRRLHPADIRALYEDDNNGCPAGTFSDGAVCEACAEGELSVEGARECFAADQFLEAAGQCPPHTFLATTGNASACQPCPVHAGAPQGSRQQTDCRCNAGYAGPDGGECRACAAGTYKDGGQAGRTECVACEAGWFTRGEGARECERCGEGWYLEGTAAEGRCEACGEGAESAAGSVGAGSCVCRAGWAGPDGGRCERCVAGSYKPTSGSAECTPCKAGWFANESGSASCTHSALCRFNQYIAGGAVSDLCADCPANTATTLHARCSSSLDNGPNCSATLHLPNISDLDMHLTVRVELSAYIQRRGITSVRVGGTPISLNPLPASEGPGVPGPPPVAHYEGANLQSNGVLMDSSVYGRHIEAPFISGVTKRQGSGHGFNGTFEYIEGTQDSFILFPDYTLQEVFTLCSVTRYTSDDPGKQGRILGSLTKQFAHGHYDGNPGVVYYREAFKFPNVRDGIPGPATDWVVVCGHNNPNAVAATGFQVNGRPATVERTGGEGGHTLAINRGPGMPEEASAWAMAEVLVWDSYLSSAEQAAVSHYLMAKYNPCTGAGAPQEAPRFPVVLEQAVPARLLDGAALRVDVATQWGAGALFPCQDYLVAEVEVKPKLTSGPSDCLCNAGYAGPPGGPCAPCAAGTVAPVAGSERCVACPPGQFQTLTGQSACAACPAGQYHSGSPDESICAGCPEHSHSEAAAASAADCTCNAGFSGPLGGPCVACEPGTYKEERSAGPCRACPAEAWSGAGSASRLQCACNAGYAGTLRGECVACAESGSCNAALYGECVASSYHALHVEGPDVAYPGVPFEVTVRKQDFYGQTISTDSTSILQAFPVLEDGTAVTSVGLVGSQFGSLVGGEATFSLAVRPTYAELDAEGELIKLLGQPHLKFEGTGRERGESMRSASVQVELAGGAEVCPTGSVLYLEETELGLQGACRLCSAGSYSVHPLLGRSPVTGLPECVQCPAGGVCLGGSNVTFARGSWEVDGGYWTLVSCPAGHQLVTSSEGVVLQHRQECRPCGHTQYIVDPDRHACQDCPIGAVCDGSSLRTRGGLDSLGARWEADEAGLYFLVACPTGYRLVDASGGYDGQQCVACGEGEFIMSSSDPSLRCRPCPNTAVCPGGGPPVFADTVRGSLTVRADAGGVEWSAGMERALVEAVAAALGLDTALVTLSEMCNSTQPACSMAAEAARRAGAVAWEIGYVVHMPREQGGAQNRSALLNAVETAAAGAFASRGVVVTVDGRQETDRDDALQGWTYVLTESGQATLVSCPAGYLVINASIDEQTCFLCPPTSYSLNPQDNCDGAVCRGRTCTRCPRGAVCRGGNHFQSLVEGAVWLPETFVDEGGLRSEVLRLRGCPAGHVLVHDAADHASDACMPCPFGTYALESPRLPPAEDAGERVGTATDAVSGVGRWCGECPDGAVCAGGSLVASEQDFWRQPGCMRCHPAACPDAACDPRDCRPCTPAEEAGELAADLPAGERLRAVVLTCPPGVCEAGRCVEGNEGPVCGWCKAGHAKLSHVCEPCDDDVEDAMRLLLWVLVPVLGVVLWLVLSWRPLLPLRCVTGGSDGAGASSLGRKLQELSGELARSRTVITSVIAAYQILASFYLVYKIRWMPRLEPLMQYSAVTNLDVFHLPGLNCLWRDSSFQSRLLVGTLAPLAAIALHSVPAALVSLKAAAAGLTARQEDIAARVYECFWRSLVVFCILVYPVASVGSLRAFHCYQELELVAQDFTIRCPALEGGFLLAWSVAFTLLFPVGIPAAMLAVLFWFNVPRLAHARLQQALLEGLVQYVSQQARERLLNVSTSTVDTVDTVDVVPVHPVQYSGRPSPAGSDSSSPPGSGGSGAHDTPREVLQRFGLRRMAEPSRGKGSKGSKGSEPALPDDLLKQLCDRVQATLADTTPADRPALLAFCELVPRFLWPALLGGTLDADPDMDNMSNRSLRQWVLEQGKLLKSAGVLSVRVKGWERATADEAHAIGSIGGLFVQYRVDFWYWELVEMARKITVGLFTLLFFFSAFIWGNPYCSVYPNYLQAYIQFCLFCTLYYGQQSAECRADPELCSDAVQALVLALQASILCFPLATFLYMRIAYTRPRVTQASPALESQ